MPAERRSKRKFSLILEEDVIAWLERRATEQATSASAIARPILRAAMDGESTVVTTTTTTTTAVTHESGHAEEVEP